MARLSGVAVKKAKGKAMLADGGGLYLQITATGTKSWLFRYRSGGGERYLGLGGFPAVSLEKARLKAHDARTKLADGIDPLEAKKAQAAAEQAARANQMTFRVCAELYVASHEKGWRNQKHRQQWTNTLSTYAYPIIGAMTVAEIEVAHVMKVLEPIWHEKPETASRVRGRVESILDYATVAGFRKGDNPAQWRGRLSELLPPKGRVQPVKHHGALPYSDIGAFVDGLRQQPGTAALALEFMILTVTRTVETMGARFEEFDLERGIWTIPAERIKTKVEHRVPLSAPALAIVKKMAAIRTKGASFVFPGGKKGKPLSSNAFLALLKRMGRDDITAHGFRSTFRDWAAEQTHYPREVCEMALAHAVGDKVEAAYRRGDLFAKRSRLMTEWAKYCDTIAKAGEVVRLSQSS
jgi:integrase